MRARRSEFPFIMVQVACAVLFIARVQGVLAAEFDLRLTEAASSTAEFQLAADSRLAAIDLLRVQQPQGVGAGYGTGEFIDLHNAVSSRRQWRQQDKATPEPDVVAAPDMKPKRWLKKHWYVPVLAAAALYAIVEDSRDNIRDGVGCGCG